MLKSSRLSMKRVMVWIIVIFIAATFALLGLSDYFSVRSSSSVAVKVNGQKIGWQKVRILSERMRSQYGQEQVNDQALIDQVRVMLAQRLVLSTGTRALGFRVGDEQTAKVLVQIPAFQEEGKFSKERYLELLSRHSLTDEVYRQELAEDVLLGQLEQGLAQSSFTLKEELETLVGLVDQTRDFGYMVIPFQRGMANSKVPFEAIQAEYDAHKANYVKPEQVAVEYIRLSLEKLAKQQKVSREELLAFYEKHKSFFVAPERVRARHILIKINKTEQEAEAQAKAEALLAEIKQGADFSAKAKKTSADVGTSAKGGDLGWFVRGQMVPEFEKAVFALKKPGELAGPIKTQFGYHIIQLVEHKDSSTRSFQEVLPQVEEQVRKDKAQAAFAEKSEALAKLAFEQPNALTHIATELGLKVELANRFDRQSGTGIAEKQEVREVAFSEPVLTKKLNSGPIKLAENDIAILRVKKHFPATQQTLEQVSKQIEKRLNLENAKRNAKEKGELILKSIQKGEKPSVVAKQHKLQWIEKRNVTRTLPNVDRTIGTMAFQSPKPDEKSSQPGVVGLMLPNGDFVVLVVTKVTPGNINAIDEGTKVAYRQSISDISSQLEYALYSNALWSDALNKGKIEFMQAQEGAKTRQ